MSSTVKKAVPPVSPEEPRRRLAREERYRQLMDAARQLVREEGTQALTLGRLAERSGVTKPVVYDHFGALPGLLSALYLEFAARQTALMNAALAASRPTLWDKAAVIAASYVSCFIGQGRELPGVIAALDSTPELQKVKRECELAFMSVCESELAPFAAPRTIAAASLWGVLGAAEALSTAATEGVLSAAQAEDELRQLLVDIVGRSRRSTG
ncbi:TetR/AcrR family transcriptional regulator [Paucibacter sp. O1-1]|nr:TetR/AcrR family transcriptional regulator [Paucibacter sp. O1-1]MDA3828916.1 TetR/AcrR family transcriptional regulator [Paucibacter sp. O1-1]